MTNARRSTLVLGTLLMLGAPAEAAASPATAPPTSLPVTPPTTAEVLGRLRASAQHDIEAGKLAKQHGNGKPVKELGAMLVKDHEATYQMISGLAKEEKIDLGGATPAKAGTMAMVPDGPAFDAKFAQMIVDDHKRDIAAATAARDSTTDDKLKQLLTKLIPTLQKHQEAAQKIIDTTPK